MNGMCYTAPINNIFEERIKQYNMLYCTVIDMFTDLGYSLRSETYIQTDPSQPSLCKLMSFENEDEDIMELVFPDIDKNIAFINMGIRWIPVFQITDDPIFVMPNKIILRNSFCTLVLNNKKNMYTVNKHMEIPVFLLMVELEKSYDIVLEKLHIPYDISTEPMPNRINVPIYNNTFICAQKTDISNVLLNPFELHTIPEYEKYKQKIQNLSEEDYPEKLIECWTGNSRHLNLKQSAYIKDHVSIPNVFFKEPYNLLDLLYYMYLNLNTIDFSVRDINDINKRRLRLHEWLLSKLSYQYKKYFVNDKSKKIYKDSIMDVINVDQRRILDDTVNPLGELCIMSRVIYNGKGGVAEESCNATLRNLHDSYYGFIDPIDTPTGKAVGVCQHIIPENILKNGKLISHNSFE